MSLKLTIEITQVPDGVGWTIQPGDQTQATASERKIGHIFLYAIEEVMKDCADKLGAPLSLRSYDRPKANE